MGISVSVWFLVSPGSPVFTRVPETGKESKGRDEMSEDGTRLPTSTRQSRVKFRLCDMVTCADDPVKFQALGLVIEGGRLAVEFQMHLPDADTDIESTPETWTVSFHDLADVREDRWHHVCMGVIRLHRYLL